MSRDDKTLDDLCALLADQAARPLSEARALPPEAYLSPDLLALERREIFGREWLCAGRADELRGTGDYLTFPLGAHSAIVMRQKDGTLKAFANVCRHRMMTLLEGRGTCRKIVCPYHGWSYDLAGRLKTAPHMEHTADFDPKSIRLAELACEVWQGWIYVSLDPQAPPLADGLAQLELLVAPYGFADYVHVIAQDHVWKTNWKVLTGNFMESLHLPFAHRRTVGAWLPLEETAFDEEHHPAFTYETFPKDEDAVYGVAHPKNTRLKGEMRRTSIMPTVFPSHMYVLAPDHCWYLSLTPKAVDEVHVRFGVSLAPEVVDNLEDPESEVAELEAFFNQVNDEDRRIVEGVQQGLSSPLASPGQLSWLERELHDFHRYLARRLCSPRRTELREVGT